MSTRSNVMKLETSELYKLRGEYNRGIYEMREHQYNGNDKDGRWAQLRKLNNTIARLEIELGLANHNAIYYNTN